MNRTSKDTVGFRLVCALVCLTAGCSHQRWQERAMGIGSFDQETIDSLVPDSTTKDDALRLLSTPSERGTLQNGVEVFGYSWVESIPEEASEARIPSGQEEGVYLLFSADGVLRSVFTRETSWRGERPTQHSYEDLPWNLERAGSPPAKPEG